MANTLQDILNKSQQLVYSGGQLQATNTPGVQQLASAAGLSTTPTTPSGISSLGGTPQQQVMAGSPLQVKKATQIAVAPTRNLRDVLELKQPDKTTSAEQQAQITRAQDLNKLSTVPERVSNLINSKIASLTPAVLAPEASSASDLVPDLNLLISNPANPQALARINSVLGRGPTTPLSPEEVLGLIRDPEQAIKSATAASLPTQVLVSDLVQQPEFGFDLARLSNVLGLPPEQVGSMSVLDLQAAVQAATSASNQAAQVEAGSLGRGQAEQAAFRDVSKQLEASGVASAESQLSNLAEAVGRGDVVNFGGQNYTISDLLGKDGITKLVSDYLDAPPDSPLRRNLDQTEPELAKFINSNYQALSDIRNKIGTGVGNFNKIQATTAELSKIGNTQLSDEVMHVLLPTWGSLQAGPVEVPAVLGLIRDLPPAQQEQVAGVLNTLGQSYPDLVKQIPNLTSEELLAIADPATFSKLQENTQTRTRISSAIRTNNVAEALSLVLGHPVDVEQVKQQVAEDRARKLLGLPTSGISDKLGGNLDSASSILEAAGVLAGTSTPGSLQEVARGGETTYSGRDFAEPELNLSQSQVLAKFEPYIQDYELHLTPDQFQKLGVTPEDLDVFRKSGFLPKLAKTVGLSKVEAVGTRARANSSSNLLRELDIPEDLRSYSPSILVSLDQKQSGLADLNQKLAGLADVLVALRKSGQESKYNLDTLKSTTSKLQEAKKVLEEQIKYATSLSALPGPASATSGGLGGKLGQTSFSSPK